MRYGCLCLAVLMVAVGCETQSSEKLADIDVTAVKLPECLQRLLLGQHNVTMLSLDPIAVDEPGEDCFYSWRVLGQTQLNSDEALEVIHGVKCGLATAPDYSAACFDPRHGLSVSDGSATVDLVICFECVAVQVYLDGQRIDGMGTSDLPLELFNSVLRAKQIELPPQAGD